jgi:hypothetical protein
VCDASAQRVTTVATHSYDNGGWPDGRLSVSVASFYGDDCVRIDVVNGDSAAHLTAEQARALAADLLTHASQLGAPTDEELIRDATEATDNPGRIVTR